MTDLSGGGLRATEYLYKTDARQGITTYTLQNRTVTIPTNYARASGPTAPGEGFSVYLNVKGKKNEESVNASLKRRKRKLFMKRSSSGDVAKKSEPTDRGYATISGPAVHGEVEETKVEVAMDSDKPNPAVMDVIAKAKSLAYQSDPEVDEAMKSEALTDELKGAIIELKMVPKIENKSKMPEWKDQPRTERSDLLRRSRSNSSQNMHDTYKKRNSGRTFLYANDDSDTSSSVIPGYGTGFDEDTEIETINQNSWSQRVPVSGGNTENTHIRLSQQSVYSLKEAEKDNGIVVYKPAEPQPERCLSPDTVTENILEGLDDSEVYDGNVTLNRIFSLRRDIVQYRHKDPKRKRSSTTEYTSGPQSQRNSEIVQENVMQETSVPVLQSEVITTEVDICRENQGKTRTKTDPQHEVQSDEDIFGDTCVSSSINVSLEDVLGDVSDSEMDIMTSEALVKRGAQPSVFANKTVERYSPEETFEHVVEDVIGETSDFESDNDLLNEKKTAHLSYDYITRNETSLTSSCEAMVDDNPRSVSSYQTRPSCSEASQDEESDASMSWQAQQGNLFEEYITHTEGLTDSIHSQYTGRPKSELVNEEVSQSNGTYYITETVRTTSTTSSVFTSSQRMSCTEEEEVVKVPLDNERVVITLEPIKSEETLDDDIFVEPVVDHFDLDRELESNRLLCSESEGSLGSLLDDTSNGGYSGSESDVESDQMDFEDIRDDRLRENWIVKEAKEEKERMTRMEEALPERSHGEVTSAKAILSSDVRVEEVKAVTAQQDVDEDQSDDRSRVCLMPNQIVVDTAYADESLDGTIPEQVVPSCDADVEEVEVVTVREEIYEEQKQTFEEMFSKNLEEKPKKYVCADTERRQQIEESLVEFKRKMELLTESNVLEDDVCVTEENIVVAQKVHIEEEEKETSEAKSTEKKDESEKELQIQTKSRADVDTFKGQTEPQEIILAEEIITQEIILEIKIPKKKGKKRKEALALLQKNTKPVRDLHLRRVTRLTDCDVEIVDGKSIAAKESPEVLAKKLSIGSPSYVEKVPLDESVEQHAHDDRMPLVVEVHDRSSSICSSGPLSPLLSPQGPMSPAVSQSGIHINRDDGLRSPVTGDVEFLRKESSDTMDSDFNVHREETLKVLQVPDSATSFMMNIKAMVNKMGSTINENIDDGAKSKISVMCHANETVQRSPDPDEIESRTTCISKVLVGPEVLPVIPLNRNPKKMIEITSSSVQELRPPPEVGEQEPPSTAKEEHQQEIPRHSDDA